MERTQNALNDTERIDWLRLIRTRNVGPHMFIELIDRFGTAVAAIDALPELSRRAGGR
jgi:DNA processing protein